MISVESREHRLAHLPGHVSIGLEGVAERGCFTFSRWSFTVEKKQSGSSFPYRLMAIGLKILTPNARYQHDGGEMTLHDGRMQESW